MRHWFHSVRPSRLCVSGSRTWNYSEENLVCRQRGISGTRRTSTLPRTRIVVQWLLPGCLFFRFFFIILNTVGRHLAGVDSGTTDYIKADRLDHRWWGWTKSLIQKCCPTNVSEAISWSNKAPYARMWRVINRRAWSSRYSMEISAGKLIEEKWPRCNIYM